MSFAPALTPPETLTRARRLVWLASYPKSGNTWLRFILSEIILGEVRGSADIFVGTPLEPGLKPEDLVRDRMNVVKCHRRHDPRHLLEPHARGAVVLVRDPVKVMVSNLRYFLLGHGGLPEEPEARHALLHAYIGDYIRGGGDLRWRELGWGTWSDNVMSWLGEKTYPVELVRYEDLLERPVEEVLRICAFAEISASRERVAAAVNRWRLENMRALEEREIRGRSEGMFWKEGYLPAFRQGFRFCGAQGSPLAQVELEPELVAEARRAFEPAISALGYR